MDSTENRRYVIGFIFIAVGLVFFFRLMFIQVFSSHWEMESIKISEDKTVIRPTRGLIYDRNGKLMVTNVPVYDLMIIPKRVKQIDTLEFCKTVGITKEEFIEKVKKARSWPNVSYKPSIFEKQIPAKEYARIVEKLYKFPGFFGEPRIVRGYPEKVGAHVLGYIGEVSPSNIKKDAHYSRGDYIGVSGIERQYENELRGKKGVRYFIKDAFGNKIGSFEDGKYDTLTISGNDLVTTLDLDLQAYGEKLMQNKKGSIVAIEPQTGEILTMVTSPTYDPNLLVGRIRTENYRALNQNDSLKPLFNRALKAQYRPGSIFKLIQALIGMEEKVIRPTTGFPCDKKLIGCHDHPPPYNVKIALTHSCNPYFYNVYKRLIQQGKDPSKFKDSRIGLEIWRKYVLNFGLGTKLQTDLPNPNSGLVPTVQFYDKWYGKERWAFSTIYSNSIGEGELMVVPLQMANLAAICANKGFFYTPHVVKVIGTKKKYERFKVKHETKINSKYFGPVIEAMQSVVESGTGQQAKVEGITVCGKTGTVENKDLPNHSVFIAFAPLENPKIALAIYVEYTGDYGGTWAGPIASLMIEKYLNREVLQIKKEEKILNANFLELPINNKKN